MLHKFFEEGYWFAPKKLGQGSGWPTAWQGWVLLLGFLALVLGIAFFIDGGTPMDMAIGVGSIIVLTIPFMIIVKNRTPGRWKK